MEAIYRHYDQYNRLLYVGRSIDPVRRQSEHSQSPWYTQVKRIEVQHCLSREHAKNLEKILIREERPLYNVVHSRCFRSFVYRHKPTGDIRDDFIEDARNDKTFPARDTWYGYKRYLIWRTSNPLVRQAGFQLWLEFRRAYLV